jgi:hypothetical protein
VFVDHRGIEDRQREMPLAIDELDLPDPDRIDALGRRDLRAHRARRRQQHGAQR